MEIVKHVIGVKLAEADDAKKAADRAAERTRIKEVLANKNDIEMQAMSKEQLEARLKELGG